MAILADSFLLRDSARFTANWAFPLATAPAVPMEAQTLSGLLLNPAMDGANVDVAQSLAGVTGAGGFLRDQVPWRDIGAWTEKFAHNSTDAWLDEPVRWIRNGLLKGTYAGNHRWMRHHPVDFFKEWMGGNPNLHLGEYARHMGLDVITTRGIPLAPESVHQLLLSWGLSEKSIVAWLHMNIFDLALGVVSLGTGAYQLALSITGHLPWGGFQTFMGTFVVGGLEVAVGLKFANLFLVVGGAMKIVAGGISYYQHISLPDPSLITTMLPGLLAGISAGALASVIRMGISWKSTSFPEKATIVSESLGLSSILGILSSAGGPWVSTPVGMAYGIGKLAFSLARQDNNYWDNYRISSDMTGVLSQEVIHRDSKTAAGFEKFLETMKPEQLSPELLAYLEAPFEFGPDVQGFDNQPIQL